ncbi:MAG TPA: hypothetical protein VJN90_13915 [Candidatus Acidoferrales bacterium]|nr:hypothetical protein [Candidatus Acidoferrales bacterium]
MAHSYAPVLLLEGSCDANHGVRFTMMQIIMRRIQAASLIVALLAAPFALMARGYTCAPRQCTMMCCLWHKNAGHNVKMNCHGMTSASLCVMRCNSQQSIDYGLASPFAPTQLQAAISLPAPAVIQASFSAVQPRVVTGFSRIPFEPPRS